MRPSESRCRDADPVGINPDRFKKLAFAFVVLGVFRQCPRPRSPALSSSRGAQVAPLGAIKRGPANLIAFQGRMIPSAEPACRIGTSQTFGGRLCRDRERDPDSGQCPSGHRQTVLSALDTDTTLPASRHGVWQAGHREGGR